MSNAVRSWVLLVVTLCLGIAIGVLGGGALQDRRMRRVDDIRRPGGFVEHVQRVIRPTSDSQWNAIRPLIEANADANAERRRAHDGAMRASLDSLRAQLYPLLDEAQRERLARFVPDRRGPPPGRRGPGRNRDRFGPPDDGPPPRDR
jgi:hypothetical protein